MNEAEWTKLTVINTIIDSISYYDKSFPKHARAVFTVNRPFIERMLGRDAELVAMILMALDGGRFENAIATDLWTKIKLKLRTKEADLSVFKIN